MNNTHIQLSGCSLPKWLGWSPTLAVCPRLQQQLPFHQELQQQLTSHLCPADWAIGCSQQAWSLLATWSGYQRQHLVLDDAHTHLDLPEDRDVLGAARLQARQRWIKDVRNFSRVMLLLRAVLVNGTDGSVRPLGKRVLECKVWRTYQAWMIYLYHKHHSHAGWNQLGRKLAIRITPIWQSWTAICCRSRCAIILIRCIWLTWIRRYLSYAKYAWTKASTTAIQVI